MHRILIPPTPLSLRVAIARHARRFSVLNRPPPSYRGHVPLTLIERSALVVGSAVTSLFNPRRGGSYSIDEAETYGIFVLIASPQTLLPHLARPPRPPTLSTGFEMPCYPRLRGGVFSVTGQGLHLRPYRWHVCEHCPETALDGCTPHGWIGRALVPIPGIRSGLSTTKSAPM